MRLAIAWLLACGSSSTPPPPPTPGPAPAPAPGPLVDKWKCDADGDCMNSCSQGAVSKAWYAVTAVRECEDGCANKLAAAPKCVERQCVAYREGPGGTKPDPSCTHRND